MNAVSNRRGRGETIYTHGPDDLLRWIGGGNHSEIELASKGTGCIGGREGLLPDICFCFLDVLVRNFGPPELYVDLDLALLTERGNELSYSQSATSCRDRNS